MPPLDSRRRRRRRRSGSAVLGLVVVGVALVILIGGIVHIGTESAGYDTSVNRSFAAQASVLAVESNRSGLQLRRLAGSLTSTSLGRLQLQASLDSLVLATGDQSAAADVLTPPEPSAGVAQQFSAAFADRAEAVATIRRAIDGLLGMSELPAGSAHGVQTLVSAAQVQVELVSAGALLSRSDRAYASARRMLRAAPGHSRLPASVWVTDPQAWARGPVDTLVAQLTGSPSLAPRAGVGLAAVRLDPAVLPPTGPGAVAAPGVPSVPPTNELTVSVIVLNDGNVPETGLVVTGAVAPQGPGAPATSSRTVSLGAGASRTVVLRPLQVTPGDTYILTVSLTPPAAQVNRAGLTQRYAIRVAPAAAATTTTTTPPTTVAPHT